MKVLFDHGCPFAFAHGGFQIQIEQTRLALERIGVDVEFLRWWDDTQRGDIIHFFGACSSRYTELAHAKGSKVVMSELRGGTGARAPSVLAAQVLFTRVARRLLPRAVVDRIGWNNYRQVDAAIALTTCEARIMRELSECPAERLHVIPNGVEDVFFTTGEKPRTEWLVCTATVQPGKRVLELARAACAAEVPLWIIGKPYAEDAPYYRAFREFAQTNSRWVRYDGPIENRERLAEVYQTARGFVLMSTWESQSLSALEASASKCPLLLADLPWARATFEGNASYGPNTSDVPILAHHLRAFWEQGHRQPSSFVPLRWIEVAQRLRAIYDSLASTSR